MSLTTSSRARVIKRSADQKMADGFTMHAQTVPSVMFAGKTYTAADLVSVLEARLSTSSAVEAAKASWQNTVKADRDERARTKALVDGVRQSLLLALAESIDTLADFGLAPRKTRVLTPEQKAVAAARAKATREARHTMGSVQKKDIKGAVTAALVVTPASAPKPVAAPAAATPTPAAAPVAPAGTPAPHVTSHVT